MNLNWYAVYTKPRAEAKVAQRFTEDGIEIYFPTIKELKQWSDRKKIIERPLFSSYVFIRINIKQYEQVRRIYGVVNFVYYLSKPAIIKDKEIEAIKTFLKEVEHNSIKFEIYEEVIIKTGVLKGEKGIIKSISKNSLRIILSGLKISLIARINKLEVEKINSINNS